jgi:hypothetical protein
LEHEAQLLNYLKATNFEVGPYLSDDSVSTPGASEIARNLITLPTHMGITETLAKEIALKVKDAH